MPHRLEVFTSNNGPSHGHQRFERKFTINVGAGSPDAPGSVEDEVNMSQSTLDVEGPTLEDLDVKYMEEPEEELPQHECDGSCRQRLKDTNAAFANVVCYLLLTDFCRVS